MAAAWRNWKPPVRGPNAPRWGLGWLESAMPAPAPGTLCIVGGETSVGKSFFMLSMLSAAARAGGGALYISLEDPPLEVGRRLAAGLAAPGLRVCCPPDTRLSTVLGILADPALRGVVLVGVDYLQLVTFDSDIQAWSKADSISRTASELKSGAKAAGVTLLLGSQLRRASANEAGGFPTLGRLKESGDLENMAEVVIMLGSNTRGVRAEVLKCKAAPVGALMRYQRGPGGVLVEDGARGEP
jgi:hypothetical protein